MSSLYLCQNTRLKTRGLCLVVCLYIDQMTGAPVEHPNERVINESYLHNSSKQLVTNIETYNLNCKHDQPPSQGKHKLAE